MDNSLFNSLKHSLNEAISIRRNELPPSSVTEEHPPDAGSPDTQIRHITKADANLFAELGFSQEDAQRHQAECRESFARCLTAEGN